MTTELDQQATDALEERVLQKLIAVFRHRISEPTLPFACSEQVADLFGALAKAQGDMTHASKDRTAQVKSEKGSYSYGYATLQSVWDAIREPLSKNGLAILQTFATGTDGIIVITTLAHASGQWVRTSLAVKPVAEKLSAVQAIGSAITYARRYSVMAIVGIAPDDDDDGDGAGRGVGRGAPSNQPASAPETPRAEGEDALIKELEGKIKAAGDTKALEGVRQQITGARAGGKLSEAGAGELRGPYNARAAELGTKPATNGAPS